MQGEIYQLLQIFWRSRVKHLDDWGNRYHLPAVLKNRGKLDANRPILPWKVFSLKFRSENCVKNKFYGTLRKVVRSMNRIMSSQSGKKKKKIRYESVIRVIEAAESFLTLTSSLKEESIVLRQQIFSLARGNSNSLTN